MMSFQILILATFAVFSEASVDHAGSDASATRQHQPNADETQTDVVSADVAEDIRARQAKRRAQREIKDRQMEAVREEADARAKQAMEAARNATLAADRARHKQHEEMRKAGEAPVVPASTVVHLVRVPHKKNATVHRHKNHSAFNHSENAVNASALPTKMAKALASKNVTHTTAAANASRRNATKRAEKHKQTITAKALNMSGAATQAASKGVTSAFHAARMAAEKLRKNHLAKRASIERRKSTESDTEESHSEKIKKAVIEVEGDELAEALRGVLSFPAKVATTKTTTAVTTTTTSTTTTTVTTTTTTVAITTTTPTMAAQQTNVSTNVTTELSTTNESTKMNSSVPESSTAGEAPTVTKEDELAKIDAEITKDQEEKKKAVESDDLETALALKKDLAGLMKKRSALEGNGTTSLSNSTKQQPAGNKTSEGLVQSVQAETLKSPLKAAKVAASKLRGSHE